jgi:hypothetical protein
VDEVVAEAVMVMENATIQVHMTKSTERKRNATSATEKGIHQRIVLRSQVTTMIVLWRVLLAALRKSRRILNLSKKNFTTVNTQLAQLKEADSDISESEEDEEASHFQVDQALQFAQVDKKFEPRISKLFKQTGSSIKLDLWEVILLDSQSTMDLFCNAALVSKTRKSNSSMRLKSNGGTMVVTRKEIFWVTPRLFGSAL